MRSQEQHHGSVLIAVAWCVVLLAVGVFSMLHSTRVELRVAKNHGDRQQAHYLALAGIEKAKAVIYQETRTLRQNGRTHTTAFFDNRAAFENVRFGIVVVVELRSATMDRPAAADRTEDRLQDFFQPGFDLGFIGFHGHSSQISIGSVMSGSSYRSTVPTRSGISSLIVSIRSFRSSVVKGRPQAALSVYLSNDNASS